MKRLLHIQFLLVLLLALGYSPLQAKRITQWQAQQQAYSFWGKQMPQKAKAKSRTATTIIRKTKCFRILERNAKISKTKRNFSRLYPTPQKFKKIDRLRRNEILLKAVRMMF